MPLLDLSKYPFVVDAEWVAGEVFGLPSFLDVLTVRRDILEAGLERIRMAVRRGVVEDDGWSYERVVGGFHAAVALAKLAGNQWLSRRLAVAEAERAHRLLSEDDDAVVAMVARKCGLPLEVLPEPLREPLALVAGVPVYREYKFRVLMPYYATAARRLLGDPTWATANQAVVSGYIHLLREQAVRLTKEAVNVLIEELAAPAKGIKVEELPEPLRSAVEEARRVAAEDRPLPRSHSALTTVDSAGLVEDALPPCMAELLERARRGEHLSHHERFALATFLLNIGLTVDEVLEVFKNMPDFNERIARYQVEHLAGLRGSRKRYLPYSCEKMRMLGLCRGDCNARNPLAAYARRLRGRKVAPRRKSLNRSTTGEATIEAPAGERGGGGA